MLVSAEFDTVECSLLETLVFLSALVSMTASSPACLLLPWQDYFFFCLLSSITLLLWSLKYYCGRGSIFSSLFSIPLICLRGHSPLWTLMQMLVVSSLHLQLPPFSPELRTKVPVYLLDISTTKSCRHLETLGSPNWPHYFVPFCYLHSCLHFPSGYITLLFQ